MAMKQAKLPQYGLLILIVGVYAGLAWFNSTNIPLSKAPDEYVHFRYIRFIVEHGRLPQTNAERQATGYKADQPPLYYGLVALATGWIKTDGPPTLKMTWDSPRRKLIDLVLPRAMIVRTEDETWPYTGIVLAWMVGRWLSILMGAVTIILVYLVTAEIFPSQPGLALAAAATLAFIPCFIYISAVLSDENPLGVVVGLYFLCLVRFSKGQRDSWTFMALGLLMGLAVITKYSAIVLPLEFLLVLAVVVRRQLWPWRRWACGLAVVAIAGVIASGGWFLFQAWYFNRVEEFGPVAGIIRPLIAGDESLPGVGMLAGVLTGTVSDADRFELETQGSLLTWISAFFTKFWVVEIVGAQPPFPPYYTISLMLAIVLLAGLGWWFIWQRNQNQERGWLLLLLLHLFIFVPIPLVRFLLSGRINDTAQARYLVFSAAPAVGLLLAWGLAAAAGEKHRLWVLPGLVGVMVALSGVSAYHFWTGFPPPLPVRTAITQLAPPPQPVSIHFNDGFELTGYDRQINGDGSVLQVTLYWRSLAYAHEDYETYLSLLDNEGQVVAETATQPAQGRYPVRAWDPGDSLHDRIFLPLTGVAAGSYQLQLQLIGWQRPLDAGSTDTIILGQVDVPGYLSPKLGHVLTSSQAHLVGFDLWQTSQIASGQPVYRYRAAIPITVSYQDVPAEAEVRVWLVGPDQRRREPVTGVNELKTFIVDYDWPSGPYDLEVELWQGNQRLDQGYSKAVLIVENQPFRFEPPSMSYQVGANFGGRIELLGYDLPLRRVEAGQGVPLVLYWRGLTRMREDYTIFVQLLDAGQQRRGGYDRYPRENYNTYLWLPGEVIDDGFAVPVEADAPHGIYTIRVGLYQKEKDQAIALPLVRDGQALSETSMVIGPVKVGGPPAEMVLSPQALRPQNKVGAILGEPPAISLRGYDLTQQADGLHLTLYWESLSQTPVDWSVFVHLRNKAGQTVAQKDGPAGRGLYPTSLWEPGEIIEDDLTLTTVNLLEGSYDLFIGLYNLTTGQRLAVPGNPANEVLLMNKIALNPE